MTLKHFLLFCSIAILCICCETDSEEDLLEIVQEKSQPKIPQDSVPEDTTSMKDTTAVEDTIPKDTVKEVLINYESNIKPIIDANCAIPFCHTPPTNSGGRQFDNYTDVAAGSARISARVNSTSSPMPPGNREKLNDEEKALIAKWIEDGLVEK